MDEYVKAYASEDGKTEIYHRHGVPWHNAPIPPRKHVCWAQTDGWINYFTQVQRCACGAIRGDGYMTWMERNSRQSEIPKRRFPKIFRRRH